jgi:hypothetical protein
MIRLLAEPGFVFDVGTADEANSLLAREHYLGPLDRGHIVIVGLLDGETVAAQIWTLPTSRRLPSDGSWLELARWCLTPRAGKNAGSRMHKWVVRWLRQAAPSVTTLVSYSDPSVGHTGSLYRACNWHWAPTWHRLRPPPSANGDWGSGRQAVKDRWVFEIKPDERRRDLLCVRDRAGAGFADQLRYGWAA